MNRVVGVYQNGQIIARVPEDWPDGARVEVTLAPSTPSCDELGKAPQGVRLNFWRAINDPNVEQLDDAFWPLSREETEVLLKHMDAAEPLDFTPDEIDNMEQEWERSKEQQKEMTRQSWDESARWFE